MKKWGFLLLILACLCFIFINNGAYIEPNAEILNVEVRVYDPNDQVKAAAGETSDFKKVQMTADQLYQGHLLLVNSEYPVREESIQTDIVNLFAHRELVDGFGLLNNDTYLSKDIAQKFSDMMAFAKEDGVYNFRITSGYRSFEEQRKLYQELGSDTALPAGYSEHHLGISLDVGTTHTKMARAPEGEWIEKNAWKHGFILRYPKDKSDITGIQYEPWHIRYVGLPHSAIMKEKNFVLEEYLEFLKEKKKIAATVEGKNYTVSYHSFSENMTINVPKNHNYDISGDNVAGVIVTVYE